MSEQICKLLNIPISINEKLPSVPDNYLPSSRRELLRALDALHNGAGPACMGRRDEILPTAMVHGIGAWQAPKCSRWDRHSRTI